MKFHYEGMKNFIGTVNEGNDSSSPRKERRRSEIGSRSSFGKRSENSSTANKYQENQDFLNKLLTQ